MNSIRQNHVAFRIREFEMIQGIVVIPQDSIWYRAYDPNLPILDKEPLFFGDMEVAHMYARSNQGRKLGEFRATRQLYLLDLRYVTVIMSYLYRFMTATPEIIHDISVALGTCSLARQIELLAQMDPGAFPNLPQCIQRLRDFKALSETDRPAWVNPIEQQGVRVGITDLDYKIMSFFKMLFPIDGVIAPEIPTPFHDQRDADIRRSVLYEEVVLFNPVSSVSHVQDRPITDRVQYFVQTVPFEEAYIKQHYRGTLTSGLQPPRIRYMSGGGDPVAMHVRDKLGEDIQRTSAARKKFASDMKPWKKTAKALLKVVPSLGIQHVSIPVCKPE